MKRIMVNGRTLVRRGITPVQPVNPAKNKPIVPVEKKVPVQKQPEDRIHRDAEVLCFWHNEDDYLPLVVEKSIQSWINTGHGVKMFVYKPYRNVPDGVVMYDMGQLLPLEQLYNNEHFGLGDIANGVHKPLDKEYTHASDLIRYRIASHYPNDFWCDTDVVMVKNFNKHFNKGKTFLAGSHKPGKPWEPTCGFMFDPEGLFLPHIWSNAERLYFGEVQNRSWCELIGLDILRHLNDIGIIPNEIIKDRDFYLGIGWDEVIYTDDAAMLAKVQNLVKQPHVFGIHLWNAVLKRPYPEIGQKSAMKFLFDTYCYAPKKQSDHSNGIRSYSQLGEDVLVSAIFKSLKIKNPSYLDIGAFDPFVFSNTALLYESGSRGINIEPNPRTFGRFVAHRQGDINLNIGVSATGGDLEYHEIKNAATLNTFSKESAQEISEKIPGYSVSNIQKIKTMTIGEVVKQYYGGKYPDFLSIDVEGLEEEILKSIDWSLPKEKLPTVICIETTDYSDGIVAPHSKQIVDLIKSKGYFDIARNQYNTIFVRTGLSKTRGV